MAAQDDCALTLQKIHDEIRFGIEARLGEFDAIWKKRDSDKILSELFFCILTPQSEAHGCWDTICSLKGCGKLYDCSAPELAPHLHKARFKNKKACYLVEARTRFEKTDIVEYLESFDSPCDCRDDLVARIKGMGCKEASHFLRNIGLGREMSILDRHILRTLVSCGVLMQMPKNLGRSQYIDIENKMKAFAIEIEIPLSHLDFVIWHSVKNEIFK